MTVWIPDLCILSYFNHDTFFIFSSVVKFSTAESEELISDVYHFRVTDAIDVVKFDARIPLYSNIDMNEQPALKYADGRVVEFEGIVVEEEVGMKDRCRPMKIQEMCATFLVFFSFQIFIVLGQV